MHIHQCLSSWCAPRLKMVAHINRGPLSTFHKAPDQHVACLSQTCMWLVFHRPVRGLFFTDLYVACFSQTCMWLVFHRPVCGLFFTDLYVACFSQTCMWLVCHRVPLATQKTRQLPAPEAGWITGLYTCLVLVGHGLRRKRERLEKWVTSALRHTRHHHTGACSVAVSFLFLLSFIRHCTCFLFA